MALLPTVPGVQPSVSPEMEHKRLRDELDALSIALRRHNSKEEIMPVDKYKASLRRAIEITSRLNHTTAGPKAKVKKVGAGKAGPLSLADL